MLRSVSSFILVFYTLVVFGQDNSIPSSIQVPSGSRLIWQTYAKGVQIYVCTQDPKDSTNFIWSFKEPRANLYADTGYHQLVGHHYFDAGKNPTWEAVDGSKVSGVKVQQANSPDSSAIPWLLLQATVKSEKGQLARAIFIQRVRTKGGKAPGKAPATGARQNIGQSIEVPYTAEYLFYSEKLPLSSSDGQPYMGKPFQDSLHHDIQTIPGRLQCALYDLGGEGIAYHDIDSINQGSGKLNPADGTYLNEFRMTEGVDISYTKFREPPIDNNAYNLVIPPKNQLYVGWTSPGEWIKYTVLVKETGTYTLGLMYTANQGGKISISVNDIDTTGLIDIPSTYVKADPIQWRQWHHWNYIKDISAVKLNKGIQIITLYTRETGQMNYGYIDFTLVPPASARPIP